MACQNGQQPRDGPDDEEKALKVRVTNKALDESESRRREAQEVAAHENIENLARDLVLGRFQLGLPAGDESLPGRADSETSIESDSGSDCSSFGEGHLFLRDV